MLKCERATNVPSGMTLVAMKDGGALFRPSCGNGSHRAGFSRPAPKAVNASARNWQSESERFKEAITAGQTERLAADLGVTVAALSALSVGWASADELRGMKAGGAGWSQSYPDGAFTFSERDGNGRIAGLSLRSLDGCKGTPSGAKRGLIVPVTLKDRADPVLIVEGASDVAACETLHIAAVGRPSNATGAELLASMLEDREIIVMGENDQKSDGSWPGRTGAKAVASYIASAWGAVVKRALPPSGVKDVRAWLQARVAAGLNLADVDACRAAGMELVSAIQANVKESKQEKLGQSELLVQLALQKYRIGIAEGDEPFAVEHDGPNVALMFRGSRDALRSAMSRDFRRIYGKTPSASALTDALTALQGEAHESAPERVSLRLAEHDGTIVLDLGGADGRAVVIRPGGWEVVDSSPVLFRRTALTGALPNPRRGGTLDLLREFVNVSNETWPLALGWVVAAMIPGIPHPIVMAGGGQGSGKTYGMKCLVGVFDSSPAPLRSQPNHEEQWAFAAAGSYGIIIDNISSISGWWSDCLCKAVTGDGWVRRKLYTDGELAVLSFRRVIALTSIDAGALKGDLGERAVMLDFEKIPRLNRRSERVLDPLYAGRRPLILGALLDLTASVMDKLGIAQPGELPRMADFGEVLAAMDSVLGTDTLRLYEAQGKRIASEVIESDPVGVAVVAFLEREGTWSGTALQLLDKIMPTEKPSKEWPKSGRGLAGRLRRLMPALLIEGVRVTPPAANDKTRGYLLETIAQTAQQPEVGPNFAESSHDGATVDDPQPPNSLAYRPNETSTDTTAGAALGDSGGRSGALSNDGVPDGWTPERWRSNLLKKADVCQVVNPALAAEYRKQAAGIRQKVDTAGLV